MPQPDPLQQLIGVVDRVRSNTSRVMIGDSAPVVTVRPLLASLFSNFDELTASLSGLVGKVALVLTDPRWAPAEAARQARELVDGARGDLDVNLQAMRAAADTAIARLVPLGVPARPEPIDAVQVAELTRREGQYRMLLDGLQITELLPRLVRLLREAVAAGDAVAVWHLAGTDWAELYLESRGTPERSAQWCQQAADLLIPALGQDGRIARQLLDVFEGQYGLRAVLQVAETYVHHRLDDIARTVPSR